MKKTKKPTRQVLQWVGEWTPSRGPTSPPKAKPIMVPFKVVRVWTLFLHTDEKDPPKLPFVPQHNVNAFLEDHHPRLERARGNLPLLQPYHRSPRVAPPGG